MVFAQDYRDLQYQISCLTDEPLPPCYYCSPEQLWQCSQTKEECTVFKLYCAAKRSSESRLRSGPPICGK